MLFHWYRWDFMTWSANRRYALLPLAGRGLFHMILDALAMGHEVPADVQGAADVLALDPDEIAEVWESVIKLFRIDGGKLAHDLIDEGREKTAKLSARREEAGRKSGEARRAKTASLTVEQAEINTTSGRAKLTQERAIEILRSAGEYISDRPLDQKNKALLERLVYTYDESDFKLVADYVGAGEHWLTKKKGERLGIPLVIQRFDVDLEDAKRWDKRGRKPAGFTQSIRKLHPETTGAAC
jgi:uncharacterized protein YdaU (DUF1376 family)